MARGARKLFGGGKDELSSFEKELGKLVVPCAPQAGRVVKIDSQYIYIDPTGTKKHAEEPRYKIPKVAVFTTDDGFTHTHTKTMPRAP